jgi:serine/threonine-protein kinase RsbW
MMLLMPSTTGEPLTPGEGARVVLEISSAVETLKLVDQVSEHFAGMAGLDEDAVHAFGVAVREAAANAIKHGNACDRFKRVHIEFDLPRGNGRLYVRVRVRDQGAGFDLSCVPDPLAPTNLSVASGRGMFLMRSFMDDVTVRPAPSGGTEVVMLKAVDRTLPAR